LEHLPGTALRVESRNGSISVIGEPQRQDVEVLAAITASGGTQEEAAERLAEVVVDCVRDPQSRLTVKARFPGDHRSGDGVTYVVRVPSVEGAELLSSNGAIRVLDTDGELMAHTSNGRIEVTDHGGPVDVATSNGNVSLSGLSGAARVRTSNGEVSVELAADDAGPVDVATSNGSVELTVGGAFQGEVGLHTSNGRVRFHNESGMAVESSLRRNRGTLVFPGTTQESKVVSNNGSITVTVKRESP
jgi:hypothetical protein